MTIDHTNAAAHSWRGNIYAVKKYRNVADPNKDNFSEHLNLNIRKSDKRNKLRYQSINVAGVFKTNHLTKDSYRMRNIEKLYQPMMQSIDVQPTESNIGGD